MCPSLVYAHFLTTRNPTLLPRRANKYSVRSRRAYMRVPPGANSPDIIVDVRVMHALHLRCGLVHVCVSGLFLSLACTGVGGSAWRHFGGIQRSSTGRSTPERGRKRERPWRKVRKITRGLIAEETRWDAGRREETLPVLCTSVHLLNHCEIVLPLFRS